MGYLESATPFTLLSNGTVKNGVIKASNGSVFSINCSNINAAACYLKLYDKASAPSTSDTPVYRALIPGSTAGGVRDIALPEGLSFATGISYRLVTTAADNGDTAVASAEVMVSIGYQ